VLATTAVALLVLPLHTRLQRLANRLVHGEVEDPWTALARLGDRLEAVTGAGEVADRVLPDLVAQVSRALRVPYAAVRLADGTTTAHGVAPAEVGTTPLTYGGVEMGRLVVAGKDLPRRERRLLEHLARQAAVAVHAVLLSRAAQAAQAGTATAREEDGAGCAATCTTVSARRWPRSPCRRRPPATSSRRTARRRSRCSTAWCHG
jgi:two-component system NarL family sensor kinase